MKVAYIYQSIDTNFAEPFAVQVHIYHQIHGLQQAGHHVNLLALQGRRVLCTSNLQVFKDNHPPESDYGKLGLSGTKAFKVVESAIRRVQAELKIPYLALFDSYRTYDACSQNLQSHDVIHERYNLLAFGGAWASRRLGIPYILEVNADMLEERQAQGNPERGLRRIFAEATTRYCFDSAQRIICVSAQLKDHLVRKWKVSTEKIVVLPNAADTQAFGRRYDVNRIRRRLGLKDEPVVMFVGGFYLWHDLGLLVKCFAQLIRKVPAAKLILVGDGRTRPVVEQLVEQNGLQPAVVLTGAVEHRRVPEMLAVADVVVAPNITFFDGHGGSPLKIYEYMAAGKAIVATRTGQVAEVIQDGHNGVLVEAGDEDGLAEAILTLLSDPAKRSVLGGNARRQAVERHSWERYLEQVEKVYLSLPKRSMELG
ncbi:MAG: glycosyltransferase family 4 protein [Anaerolineales bacterium]